MQVKRLQISNFRGFSDLVVEPRGHVIIMGEPRTGRTNVIDGLTKVLDSESVRSRLGTELDFYNQDTSVPIKIEVTIGELGPELEQWFIDYLEFWSISEERLLLEIDDPENKDPSDLEWVLRLEYRAEWIAETEHCEERVYYPKVSDPDTGSFVYARRSDLIRLSFTSLHWQTGRILDLGTRGTFRRVVDRTEGGDFTEYLNHYLENVSIAADSFSESEQVRSALQEIAEPLGNLISLGSDDLSKAVRFAPDGGSTSGLLRSLSPSITLDDGSGTLPSWCRGSTTGVLFRIAEALAMSSKGSNILALDDLGDGLDAGSAAHMAYVVKNSVKQAWITTRTPAVAEIFDPQDVVRLGKDAGGARVAWQTRRTSNKVELVTAKNWHRILLPAFSFRAVVVVEGPNDFAALHALCLRLANDHGKALPASLGVSIISAGATGGGGYSNAIRLGAAAKDMGIRSVAIIDGDPREETKKFVDENHHLVDSVVCLPEGMAIEKVLLFGLSDAVLRAAFSDAAKSAHIDPIEGLDELEGNPLIGRLSSLMKRHSLHAQFVEALPPQELPPTARRLLVTAIERATTQSHGVMQLELD